MTAKHMLIDLYDPFKRGHTSDNPIKWECVQTFRKLTLVSATTFIVHPIGKLYMVLGLLSVFFLHHLHVRPYADDRYVYFGGGFSRVAHSASYRLPFPHSAAIKDDKRRPFRFRL